MHPGRHRRQDRIVPPLVSENNSPRPTSSIIHYPQTIRSSVCPPKNNYLQNPLHPFPPFSTLHSPFSIHQSTILTSSSRSSPVLALFQGSFLRNDYRSGHQPLALLVLLEHQTHQIHQNLPFPRKEISLPPKGVPPLVPRNNCCVALLPCSSVWFVPPPIISTWLTLDQF